MRSRYLSVLLLFLMMMWVASCVQPAWAGNDEGGGKVSNVRFEPVGAGGVVIRYDLEGGKGDRWQVGITLRRLNDSTFSKDLVDVEGDVGKHVVSGRERRILWRQKDEFPAGLPDTRDYYFEIRALAESVENTSSSIWWWIGGGLAATAGSIAILSMNKNHGATPFVAPPKSYPSPPGRP